MFFRVIGVRQQAYVAVDLFAGELGSFIAQPVIDVALDRKSRMMPVLIPVLEL